MIGEPAAGPRWIGTTLVAVSAIAFGFMALFASWTRADGVSTEMLLLLRFAIAGASLAMWMVITRSRWPRGKDLLLAIAMGGVLYAGMSTCYFHGLRFIPAGLVALLLYLYPVIVTVLSRVLWGERLTPTRLIAITLAMLGLALTIAPVAIAALQTEGGLNSSSILGIALGIGCALCYSVYILVGGGITRRCGTFPVAAVVMLAAAITFAIIVLPRGDALPASAWGWGGVLGLAMLSTLLAITAFLAGLQRVGPVRASTISTLEAATSVMVGAAFLGDDFGPMQVVGGTLILVAAIIIARTSNPPAK
jgi:drug/metabolite transporter (DMT)-like permease